MTRAYLRLDPLFDEKKATYADGPFAALIASFCLAEHQPQRGRFRNAAYLRALLGKRGRHVPYLLAHRDLIEQPDGRLYLDGWDEWQEGDWKVAERVERIRNRDRQSGRERTAGWRLRNRIFERDDYTCRYCGIADYPRELLILEHVVPVTQDGLTTEDNLVTACRPCNHRKGGRTPTEAGMPLRDVSHQKRDASQPNGSPLGVSGSGGAGGSESAGISAGSTPLLTGEEHLPPFLRVVNE